MPKKLFRARLEPLPGKLHWTIAVLPFDSMKLWGRGTVRVRGEINGFPLRTSLFPRRDGTHFLIVNKQMQKGAMVHPGDEAQFVLEKDTEERLVQIPAELEQAFRSSRRLQKFFESFTPSIKTYLASSISTGKRPETRRQRAEQTAEQLMEVMEAEKDLPPMIRQAFSRNPEAAAGWKLMPASHRRMHLLGIFHYRSLDARLRRLQKAIDEMEEYAQKRGRGSFS
jgi:uncharacterized protein YdeI (YjbR/CyaY-like superfamily)